MGFSPLPRPTARCDRDRVLRSIALASLLTLAAAGAAEARCPAGEVRYRDAAVQVRAVQDGRHAFDLVATPGQRPDGTLLGGDRAGASLVSRMARFGLREAALMASLVPARLLGLADRGRIAPGFRGDLAVLDERFVPLETIVAGETLWRLRYPQS